MTDFGKRTGEGDMLKSVYDTDDSGVVDDSEATAAHKANHQNGGSDEISVAGLAGELSDNQPPKAHGLGSASHSTATLSELNAKVSDATLDKTTDTRTPAAHKASHQNGGSDELSLAGLTPPTHASRHESGGADEIDATGLVATATLVDRGDPAANDFDVNDFTTDATWRDWDLSGICPAGATWVLFRVSLVDEAAGSLFMCREKGNSNALNINIVRVQVNGIGADANFMVRLDSNREIQYYGSNVTFTAINVTVIGWMI
jgi:hypothetical protein